MDGYQGQPTVLASLFQITMRELVQEPNLVRQHTLAFSWMTFTSSFVLGPALLVGWLGTKPTAQLLVLRTSRRAIFPHPMCRLHFLRGYEKCSTVLSKQCCWKQRHSTSQRRRWPFVILTPDCSSSGLTSF